MLDSAATASTVDHSQPMSAGVNTMLRALDRVDHHPVLERVVNIIRDKTSNKDGAFFRVVAAYFFAKMAASMRTTLKTLDRGDIPVNLYTIALAASGFGKGHSINILEKQFIAGFRNAFMKGTFPTIAEDHLYQMACDRAATSGKDPAEEKEKLDKEFRALGELAFSFDSATTAAVKQMRQKLLMANVGAISLQIDEIGSNLVGSVEALTLFFELFDQGEVKQSLRKSTADSQRGEELDGKTPTNALLFGTPATLFDGHIVEGQFQQMLEAGYARRCMFGWGERQDHTERALVSARDKFLHKTRPQNSADIQQLSNLFSNLADPRRYMWQIDVPEDVGIELITYEEVCVARAAGFLAHEEVRRSEMEHRYFKALKLAGAFAFIDESNEVTMDHLYQAIKLVEESGLAFDRMMKREKNYVRLARYIADQGTELTHADLHEALPFYKSSTGARSEMMSLATAWGYKNHIIIRKSFKDEGIEVFTGETLQRTDISRMSFSWSDHVAFDYNPDTGPFDELATLVQADGLHWCNHGFENGHRTDDNVIPGFNMIVLDIDSGIPQHVAHDLMQGYRFLTYTTKRHTPEAHRFRMLLPTNYVLKLDRDDYREFMNEILAWLPFPAPTDEAANQRSKKWLSHAGSAVFINPEGALFDVLPFLPRTSKNETHRKTMEGLQSLDNLERWFAQSMGPGNRNNQLIRYALALVDAGFGYQQVEEALLSFNGRLKSGLPEDELRSTILVTVARKIHGK